MSNIREAIKRMFAIKTLVDDNERLREALEQILEIHEGDYPLCDCARHARNALSGKKLEAQ